MTAHISDEVMRKINERHLRPTSRWYFSGREVLFWAVAAFCAVAAILAGSTAVFLAGDYDWEWPTESLAGSWRYILDGVPHFWLLMTVLPVVSAVGVILATRRGYRIGATAAGAAVLGLTLLGGTAFARYGVGEAVDVALTKSLPPYESLVRHRTEVWSEPEAGRLAGTVVAVEASQDIVIKDFKNRIWRVSSESLPALEREKLRPGAEIKVVGSPVKAGGRSDAEKEQAPRFSAKTVKPWRSKNREIKIERPEKTERSENKLDRRDQSETAAARRRGTAPRED
ncbi:hypothetical protein A3C96_04205 [Candidatus Uhrbacteria bacterium RIFCSPHIGHO2_02_FULL_60_10]|uniref:Uncharacterized protein n=1 Tax=Candidatus Uhrbacteria bacterium RIFCSPHIGHO2_02_FULL_60_10 TaxID=1802392 RepID=A0A1F7U759_9BACT|nr:MAG: hypothetical protein A3C96_04205 [Candidatus Uhrbacteria bacterium RIFCSPHIGHO2_02_FULL_60_10]